jgi:hypothetical protein
VTTAIRFCVTTVTGRASDPLATETVTHYLVKQGVPTSVRPGLNRLS